ncbi:RNA splicing factor [Lithospermum erythrorhizon]|uniref:RNA splicing factor n=1 Tax=Lithospermum erythrorhizon TaxID=34254 RepID=A0AAV3QL15_LITER
MYGSRGRAMLGSGGVSDGYEIGSKRPRMDSNPYFAVPSASSGHSAGYGYSRGYDSLAFPVVRLRGLPFDCTEIDIVKFFGHLDIVDVFLVTKNERFSGEALVVFALPMHAELALQRDRQNIGRRYVEVFKCRKQDYYNAIAAEAMSFGGGALEHDRHDTPPPRPKKSIDKDQLEYTEILKLRGLPFTVKKSDILKFFGEDFNLTDDKIQIAARSDGRVTGEAFVEFPSAEEAKKAMCKDKRTIGSRYIELFPSTPDEAKRASRSSRR